MRVFVAGATGAIGRPLVPKLVAAGHDVTGMNLSQERAETVRRTGARAVVCDVFDADAVGAAVREAGAEAVVHQLTALPDRLDFREQEPLFGHKPTAHRGHRDTPRRGPARRARAASCARASLLPIGRVAGHAPTRGSAPAPPLQRARPPPGRATPAA